MATPQERFERFKATKIKEEGGVKRSFEEFKRKRGEVLAGQEPPPDIPPPATPTEGILEGFPVGATAGATGGTALAGFPFGTLAGGFLGSVAQLTAEQMEAETGVDIPLISGKRAPKKVTPEEREEMLLRGEFTPEAKKVLFETGEQLAGEGFFRALAGTGKLLSKKALSPFAKSLTPEQRATAQLLEAENIPFTPFDIQQRAITGRLEKFSEQAFISSGIMRRFNEAKVRAVESFANRELGNVGLKGTRSQMGRVAKASINDFFGNLETNSAAAFRQAAQEAGTEASIPTASIKRAAREVKDLERLVKVSRTEKVDTGILSEFGKQIFKDVKKLKRTELNFKQLEDLANDFLTLPDNITFEQARAFQKRLGRKVAQLKGLPEGEVKILFKGFAESIEEIPNPQALESLEKGKELFKRLLDFQQETTLGKLVGKSDEDIFKTVFKPKSATAIEELKTVIPASDWNLFQRQFADEIFQQAGDDFSKMDSVLRKFGDETLNAAFEKDQIAFFRKLSKVVKTTRLPEVAGGLEVRPGVGLVQIVRGRMALNVIAGKTKKGILSRLATGATIWLGPPTVTKILTSKNGAKWLTTGLEIGANHPRAAKVAEEIINLAAGTATRASLAGTRTATENVGERRSPRDILQSLIGGP